MKQIVEKEIVPKRFLGDNEVVFLGKRLTGKSAICHFLHRETGVEISITADNPRQCLIIGKKFLESNILNSDKKECLQYVDRLMKVVDRQRNSKSYLKKRRR